MKATSMNNVVTKFLPLKKLYYGKFSYKMVVFQPMPPKLQFKRKPNGKKINAEYTKRFELCKEFEKQKNKLGEKYPKVYSTYQFDKDAVCYSIYCGWGKQVRNYSYMEKVTLFFDKKEIFDDYYEIMKNWVLEVEQPINDDKSVYKNDLEFKILVRPRLFKNQFKYKVSIPVYRKSDDLFKTISSIFESKPPDTVYYRLNYYTITVLTNEISDLLFLQLTSGKKLKFQQIITPEEIAE